MAPPAGRHDDGCIVTLTLHGVFHAQSWAPPSRRHPVCFPVPFAGSSVGHTVAFSPEQKSLGPVSTPTGWRHPMPRGSSLGPASPVAASPRGPVYVIAHTVRLETSGEPLGQANRRVTSAWDSGQ